MINRLNQTAQTGRVQQGNVGAMRQGTADQTQASQFGQMMRREIARTEQQSVQGVEFSKHAMARAEERGICVDETLMGQLTSSVERAQAKGATNILAFDDTRAFIINVPHGRVITTMSQDEMRENIFTNIDGAVIL